MELVQFSDALRLTGLSESQLREWCGKRALYGPTVPARGPGRVALFSWHDIIALRTLLQITTDFGGSPSRWAEGAAHLRRELDGQFFPKLWGKSAVFTKVAAVSIETLLDPTRLQAMIVIPLDPHLAAIADRQPVKVIQGELPLVTRIGPSR